ncbi:MAG: c-type cytochrome [Anaerolineales bacterium]|nr:c-type cytochrome [Anaerolineales bacterium]
MKTFLKFGALTLVVLGLLSGGVGPARAGGWAIATLEALPGPLTAGAPVTLRFAVRQHGVTLVHWVHPSLRFVHTATGQVVEAVAEPVPPLGYFEAVVALPEAGVWDWTLDPFGGSLLQPMPALTVGPAAGAPSAASAPGAGAWTWLGLVGLAGLGAGAGVLARTRRAWAGGLALAGAFVALLGFALPPAAPAPVLAAAPSSPAETGQALFLAKGCVMCHDHTAVQPLKRRVLGDFHGFTAGPNLSNFLATPAYLRQWLADPAAVKPQTEMPRLGLSAAEIDALIAFLTAAQP